MDSGAKDVRFGTKVSQIGLNWDKPMIFSDQISTSQNVLKYDLNKSRICPIWGESNPLKDKFDILPVLYVCGGDNHLIT